MNRRGRNSRVKRGGKRAVQRKNNPRFWERTVNQNPIQRRTIRYIATAAFNSYITARCILNSFVAFDSVASAEAVLIMDSIRLRAVRIAYVSTTGLGTDSAELGFTWYGEHGPERRMTSRGTSFMPAHIVTKPPAKSFANMWFNLQDNIEAILFNCDIPQYAIVEIDYQYTFGEGTDSNAIAATNPGTGIWYAALDNSTVAPALAGLLLRPDYLAYITLTGVTSPNEKNLHRRLILEKLIADEDEREQNKAISLSRRFSLLSKNNKEECSS
jgi:hypothetical protein